MMVQHHIPQRINLLNRISVCRPHIVKLWGVLADEFIRSLVSSEKGFPVWVHVQTALANFGPFRVRGNSRTERDVMENRRYSVWERSGARLVNAVVCKCHVEIVELG